MFRLFLLMGVSWSMEVISFWTGGSAYFWIFSDIINICTGILVFFLLVFKYEVLTPLKTKYQCLKRLDIFLPSCVLKKASYHYHASDRFVSKKSRQQSNSSGKSKKTTTTSLISDENSKEVRKAKRKQQNLLPVLT